MTDSITITVPIPKSNPNSNFAGWAAKAAQKKQDRETARQEAMIAVAELEDWKAYGFPWKSATVGVHWFHKTANHKDRDNIIASLKHTIDGIKRAGLLVDDNDLTWCSPVRLTDKDNPRVEIVIEQQTIQAKTDAILSSGGTISAESGKPMEFVPDSESNSGKASR